MFAQQHPLSCIGVLEKNVRVGVCMYIQGFSPTSSSFVLVENVHYVCVMLIHACIQYMLNSAYVRMYVHTYIDKKA